MSSSNCEKTCFDPAHARKGYDRPESPKRRLLRPHAASLSPLANPAPYLARPPSPPPLCTPPQPLPVPTHRSPPLTARHPAPLLLCNPSPLSPREDEPLLVVGRVPKHRRQQQRRVCFLAQNVSILFVRVAVHQKRALVAVQLVVDAHQLPAHSPLRRGALALNTRMLDLSDTVLAHRLHRGRVLHAHPLVFVLCLFHVVVGRPDPCICDARLRAAAVVVTAAACARDPLSGELHSQLARLEGGPRQSQSRQSSRAVGSGTERPFFSGDRN
eukprot:5407414-Prymnesium_polylepis.1